MNDQAKFRVGGVYRNRNGTLMRVGREVGGGLVKLEFVSGYREGRETTSSFWLTSGQYEKRSHPTADLVPGELHLVDGRWVPVEQEPAMSMTPTLDKLEAEYEACLLSEPVWVGVDFGHELDPNAAMIARDGPARVKPAAVVTEQPASTAHPCPFASFRSPDLCATSHQVDPAHQLKG